MEGYHSMNTAALRDHLHDLQFQLDTMFADIDSLWEDISNYHRWIEETEARIAEAERQLDYNQDVVRNDELAQQGFFLVTHWCEYRNELILTRAEKIQERYAIHRNACDLARRVEECKTMLEVSEERDRLEEDFARRMNN